MQVIAPALALALSLVDLSGRRRARTAEAETRRLAAEEARAPFDLAQRTAAAGAAAAAGSDEHVLLLTMHHIVSDGWSMGVLFRELGALYEAFAHGTAVAAGGAADPVRGLRRLAAAVAGRARCWSGSWATGERQLAGASVLELPTDRPRPAVQSYRGGPAGCAAGRGLPARR